MFWRNRKKVSLTSEMYSCINRFRQANFVRLTITVWHDGKLAALISSNLAKDEEVKIHVALMMRMGAGKVTEGRIPPFSQRFDSCVFVYTGEK